VTGLGALLSSSRARDLDLHEARRTTLRGMSVEGPITGRIGIGLADDTVLRSAGASAYTTALLSMHAG
jgi:hypothetical protein